MAWLAGWTYRKSVTISRPSGAVTNYQMKISIGESSGAAGEDVDCEGNVATDFDDLRFTNSDGQTLLDYGIESISGTTPNQLATVWVRFDAIGTSDTAFYMYYGNASAPAGSSMPNTFSNYISDGFPGSTLDAQWTTTQGTPTVSGGEVTLDSNDPVTWDSIISSFTVNFCRFRVKFRMSTVHNHAVGLAFFDPTANFFAGSSAYFLGSPSPDKIFAVCSVLDVITSTTSTSWDGTAMIGELLWKSGEIKYYKDDSLFATYTTNIPTGSLKVRADGAHAAGLGSNIIDWLFVSQYVDPEPAWGSWGLEEEENPPIISFMDVYPVCRFDMVDRYFDRAVFDIWVCSGTDGVTLSDSKSFSANKVLVDAAVISEGLTSLWNSYLSLSDGVTIADSKTLSAGITLADGAAVSDSLDRIWNAYLTLTDGVSLIEVYTDNVTDWTSWTKEGLIKSSWLTAAPVTSTWSAADRASSIWTKDISASSTWSKAGSTKTTWVISPRRATSPVIT